MEDFTVIVKHLPPSLSPQHIYELLNAFGATEIKTKCIGRKKKSVAFATFNNQAAADAILRRLHQLEVAGSRLCVEYVTPSTVPSTTFAEPIEDQLKEAPGRLSQKRQKLEDSRPNINAISHSLGLDYPLNPKIRYRYPPPNPTVLTNIMNSLVAVPKFYYQVLHLMNKMNLPSPFESVSMDISMGLNMASQSSRMNTNAYPQSSEEESELESDEERTGVPSVAPTLEMVCKKLPRKTKRLLARRSLKFQPPTSASDISEGGNAQPTSDVFELPDPLVTKKIEFKLTTSATSLDANHLADNTMVVSESGTIPLMTAPNISTDEETKTEMSQPSTGFITDEQLKQSKITKEGMDLLPVYKNYQPGKPTPRLYLKNLAKQVEEEDLKFIYGRYDKQSKDNLCSLDIRLMKDGRMKGQAFVTFKDQDMAVEALNATNGYVLHGKPIVVQFARSTKPKEM